MPIGLQAAGRIYPRKMWAAAGSVSITCEHRSLRCRHWVIRVDLALGVSPLIPTFRTSWAHGSFDAMCQQATSPDLFDHLVSQRHGQIDARGLRVLEVDD